MIYNVLDYSGNETHAEFTALEGSKIVFAIKTNDGQLSLPIETHIFELEKVVELLKKDLKK